MLLSVFLLPPSPVIHGPSPLVFAAGPNHCVSLVTPQRLALSLRQFSAIPVPPKSCFFLCPHYWGPSLATEPICSVQSLSCVRLFVTPCTAACQASLSVTNSWSLFKLMSIELVMPSNHLILCCPLLPPSIFPNIRVFSNESVLCIRWLRYWSFSFSISCSMNIQDSFPLGLTGLISLLSKRLSGVFSTTTLWKHQFFGAQRSLRPNQSFDYTDLWGLERKSRKWRDTWSNRQVWLWSTK